MKCCTWTQHVCAFARKLGVGGKTIERILRQEVVKLQIGNLSVALISHRFQVDIADNVCPTFAFQKQSVCRELRRIAREAHVRQAEVAVDAAQVHRHDVPLQVSPDVSTIGEVLHGTCCADIDNGRHHHITGLQGELVDVAVCHKVDVERLRRIALDEVFRQISLSKAQHILVTQGSLKVCLELAAFLWREGVPIHVDVALGRAVRGLQVESSYREMLVVERKVDGQVVELEAALLLEGKPIQVKSQETCARRVRQLVEVERHITESEVIDVEALDWIRARNIIHKIVCLQFHLADTIDTVAQVDIAGIEACLTNAGSHFETLLLVPNC